MSWTRWNETRLVRFENYWETDAEGNNLPYLDGIIGKPKREDSVRPTALRTGQVHLIDNMAYADAERFRKDFGDQFNVWRMHLGGVFVIFNFRRGAFRENKPLRTALAHAIDRQAIHHAVFYQQGDMLDQPYPKGNFWHLEGSRSPEYDSDKAKALLKEAGADGRVPPTLGQYGLAPTAKSGFAPPDRKNLLGTTSPRGPQGQRPYPRWSTYTIGSLTR